MKNNKNIGMKYLFKFILIVVILLGGASTMHLFAQTYTITASGNTVSFPVGTSLKIEVWGAGGRGGSNATGGGGGGGAYAASTVTVNQATAYYVNIGTGSTSTAAGGDSWFAPNNNVNNALVLAKGGNSATNSTGATGGSYSASLGQVRNNGGRGANATSDGGGGGSSAGATGLGVNATNQFGAVGPTGNDGIGGNGRASSDGAGSAATIGPGGGGGGARGNNAGGAGANGRVIITVLGPQSDITTTGSVEAWVAPENVTSIEVETWGGGGRGGSRTSGSNTGFGGGGGGGYSRSRLTVNPGTTYYVNVGAGSTTTAAGGDSWFSTTNVTGGSLVRAKGGNSVANNVTTGATGGASTGGTNPAIGDVRLAGGSGLNGGANTSGGNGGASPNGGTGGNGKQNNSSGNGTDGNPPGGGGGGAYRAASSSPTGGNGGDGKVTIHTFYNLSIAKTVTTTTPLVGTNVTFTITVVNNGSNTANGIVVTDAFPTGITYVSNSASATFNAGTLTWNVGTLNPAASASIDIVGTVNASGSYANTANLTANLANNGNSSSLITLFPQQPTADLQLTKEVNNTMPPISGQVTFTLTAYNAGPQNATNVKVQDILPFGFTYVSSSAGYDNNTGIWTIGTLNKGASQVLTLTASVNAFGNYYNQAVVSASEVDPNSTNNTSGVSVYPIYPIIEVVLPCATTTYNLNNITVATPPSGSQISWHTASPATASNKIATPSNVRAGERYFVAFYNSSSNCYGATSEVLIKRSCLITNPMIRQRTK
ncbi:DUF11 domain-containing protein [Paenimyroides aestuarii]|uniref:DUF11 domain-containing protein n=1 Tax=Paenimyroides aestuarii TaxID=2968490 RepID=A0ABY5NUY3_9FLAO|nr:DUF11 domain-containing protein [Paenimyroides aestuarii]UUV22264.1 DUF11 domain-containing protein [Paenimyroides aestuarii]